LLEQNKINEETINTQSAEIAHLVNDINRINSNKEELESKVAQMEKK